MAIVTYLIRAIPLVLVKHKIKNKFFNSFLYYIPYTVLAAMTIPAIFTATGNLISAIAGLAVAIFDIAIEYQSMGRINIKRQILPFLYGLLQRSGCARPAAQGFRY